MQNGMRRTLIARSSILFVSAALFIGAYAVPAAAHADTVSCNAPMIGDFTPHIYNGHLDSFDYYVSDPSGTAYLPLSTIVAGKAVDLNYVSIWHNAGANRVMVHVDVPDELYLPADVSIRISTLQVTQGPPPICISQATFHVNLPSFYTPSSIGTASAPVHNNPGTVSSNPTTVNTHPNPSTNPNAVSSTSTGSTSPIFSTDTGQCKSINVWWLILFALLDMAISATLVLTMSFIAHSNGRLIATVLIPPALFIAMWYFIDTCHSDIWFPILSVILAIIMLTASGSPEYFEVHRRKIIRFFGYEKNTTVHLIEATDREVK
jgi:hypothetical protein